MPLGTTNPFSASSNIVTVEDDGKEIALGRSAADWIALLKTDNAQAAKKNLNYLHGKQLKEVETILDNTQKGRFKWRERGFIARFMNITNEVVQKSCMLFETTQPKYEIFMDG